MSGEILTVDSVPDGGAIELVSDDTGHVVVLRRGGQVYAYRNICPHAGRRLNWAPGRFLFDQERLVCAAHGAVFRFEDGQCLDGPCRGSQLSPVPVRDLGDGRVVVGGECARSPDPGAAGPSDGTQ